MSAFEQFFFGFQIEKTVNLAFFEVMNLKIGLFFVDIH